jgi:hypothetical protein
LKNWKYFSDFIWIWFVCQNLIFAPNLERLMMRSTLKFI